MIEMGQRDRKGKCIDLIRINPMNAQIPSLGRISRKWIFQRVFPRILFVFSLKSSSTMPCLYVNVHISGNNNIIIETLQLNSTPASKIQIMSAG